MAGVTDEGFEPLDYEEIVDSITARANTSEYWGDETNFPTTPDSGFGVHTGVLSLSISDVWKLGQEVAAQQNRDTATGVYLESLAALIGLTRLEASGSTGVLLFIGNNGAVVDQFFPSADDAARNVLTDNELTLSRTGCYRSTFSVNTVTAATTYTINVNGVAYDFLSGGSPTAFTIFTGLAAAMSAAIDFTTSIVGVDNTATLSIISTAIDNTMYTTNSAELTLDTVGGLVQSTAAITGALIFPSDSITTLVGTNVNIASVTNPSAFDLGRLEETDEELRLRMSLREQSTGTATQPAIEASLSEITGVTFVSLNQNETLVTNAEGVPPKAYEPFVGGGSEDDIAEVLWRTKPAGILTHGDITKIVVDDNGDDQDVSFSRPTTIYAWLRVVYRINNEETFPSDGVQQMKDAANDFGNSMASGADFEYTEFFGPLYTVPGVYITSIETAVTPGEFDTPTYGTTTIPVSVTESLSFNDARTIVTI